MVCTGSAKLGFASLCSLLIFSYWRKTEPLVCTAIEAQEHTIQLLEALGSVLPAGSTDPRVSALLTLWVGYRGQGFSECAADFLVTLVRLSTAQVYDRKWSLYCTWCTERQIGPIHISIGDLGDFFLHLFDRVGLVATLTDQQFYQLSNQVSRLHHIDYLP